MAKKSPDNEGASPAQELASREIVVGVCGGISAYKTAALVSRLVQAGSGVTVAMTDSARRFVTPLTFESLTARQVFTSLWEAGHFHDPQHLRLTEAADLFIVAPATANILAKIAHGLADDLLSTMIVSADCPVLIAPAMNTRMWENKLVQANVQALAKAGYPMVGPAEGWLACRTVGPGRMAEPDDIFAAAVDLLRRRDPKRVNR